MQQAGFQHAEHLQACERFGLKGHALLFQYLSGDAVQYGRRKRGLCKTGFTQDGRGVAHETEHGLRVQRKMPHIAAVGQQKVADAVQAFGYIFRAAGGGQGFHRDGQALGEQRVQRGGQSGAAFVGQSRRIHKTVARAD